MRRFKYLVLLGVLLGLGLGEWNFLYGIPSGYTEYLDVTAKIDGSDWFEMTGSQWRWQHRNWDVPEYHEGIDPTIVNGQSFLSSWPNGTGYLAYSAYNTVVGLLPIQDVFGANVDVLLEKIAGRGLIELQQRPNAANGYTLRIFFDDDWYGSHDFYRFKLYAKGISNYY